jgi:gas vesicle protein
MDNQQEIKITLKEYLELKELKDHEKFVKITQKWDNIDEKSYGMTVDWKSDGEIWSKLTNKLQKAGHRIEELVKENKELTYKVDRFASLSILEFIRFRRYSKRKEGV